MLFVLFAVVLGLPASLEATSATPDCRSGLYPQWRYILPTIVDMINFTRLLFRARARRMADAYVSVGPFDRKGKFPFPRSGSYRTRRSC
uniref:Putative ixodes 10 kDa peptide protein n=1 Tax=Ixodes ricinus TaxID=34613 RepID=A0A0K8R5V1_IXORI